MGHVSGRRVREEPGGADGRRTDGGRTDGRTAARRGVLLQYIKATGEGAARRTARREYRELFERAAEFMDTTARRPSPRNRRPSARDASSL